MAQKRRRSPVGGKKQDRSERPRTDRPTVMTAAGLLSFYEEEEALIKIKPVHVVMFTVSFIAVVVLLLALGV